MIKAASNQTDWAELGPNNPLCTHSEPRHRILVVIVTAVSIQVRPPRAAGSEPPAPHAQPFC